MSVHLFQACVPARRAHCASLWHLVGGRAPPHHRRIVGFLGGQTAGVQRGSELALLVQDASAAGRFFSICSAPWVAHSDSWPPAIPVERSASPDGLIGAGRAGRAGVSMDTGVEAPKLGECKTPVCAQASAWTRSM